MQPQTQDTIIEDAENGFDVHDTIGGRISRAREAGGYSMAQLARRLGIRTSTLKLWETDRSEPRSNRLAMLAGFLNVSPTWLLIGKGDSPSLHSRESEINTLEVELDAIQGEMSALSQRLGEVVKRLRSVRQKDATSAGEDFEDA